MNDTKDTTIPVLEHGDKMDAHAVDGQGSSTQMAWQRSCTNPISCAKAALPPQSYEPRVSQQGFRVAIRTSNKKRG